MFKGSLRYVLPRAFAKLVVALLPNEVSLIPVLPPGKNFPHVGVQVGNLESISAAFSNVLQPT